MITEVPLGTFLNQRSSQVPKAARPTFGANPYCTKIDNKIMNDEDMGGHIPCVYRS
jgi:hypothetical protein